MALKPNQTKLKSPLLEERGENSARLLVFMMAISRFLVGGVGRKLKPGLEGSQESRLGCRAGLGANGWSIWAAEI